MNVVQHNFFGSVTGSLLAMICNVSVFLQGEYTNALILGILGGAGGWIATKILDKIFSKKDETNE